MQGYKKMNRYCLDCQQIIVGRSDKKFCNDACRSHYNNQANLKNLAYIRKINAILKKNRAIMLQLNPAGKTRVSKEKLRKLGFNFTHFTHALETSKGSKYLFCYEQGYLPINQAEVLLIKNEMAI